MDFPTPNPPGRRPGLHHTFPCRYRFVRILLIQPKLNPLTYAWPG
jgi:hypothetical protein